MACRAHTGYSPTCCRCADAALRRLSSRHQCRRTCGQDGPPARDLRGARFLGRRNLHRERQRPVQCGEPQRAALERRIAAQLRETLGYDVATFVRTVEELARIAAHDPFAASTATPYHAIYLLFLPGAPIAAARRAVAALASPDDELHIHGRELYWLARRPFSESVVTAALLERTLGVPATARNITTVKKIAAKCANR